MLTYDTSLAKKENSNPFKKGGCMKKFLYLTALLSLFLASTVSAQVATITAADSLGITTSWPHTGKYGYGTRYYSLYNYMHRDLIVQLGGGGQPSAKFILKAGDDTLYQITNAWSSARVWAYWDPKYNVGPYTLSEIDQRGGWGCDWYDVSLVDGYNLPMIFKPIPGTYVDSADLDASEGRSTTYSCGTAGCTSDLYLTAPASELILDTINGVLDTNGFYCQDDSVCRAIKKTACPMAYSFPYDDPHSLMTCPSPNIPASLGPYSKVGPDYEIDFGFPPTMAVERKPTFNYTFIDAMAVTMTKNGDLKYTYGGAAANAKLSLYSCNGKLVTEIALTGFSGTVRVPALARGLYFVMLTAGSRSKTSTMMVLR
jgi:hypothetical protein